MVQCEKVSERERERERERENTRVKRDSKWWLVIVACFLNNTLRACLRWSLIPPRMGLIPLSWGLIPISPRLGLIPLTLDPIPPCMGLIPLTLDPIPPCMGLIPLALRPNSTSHAPYYSRLGSWFHSHGPNSTLCGPDSSKALWGGHFTDHKAELQFSFAFLFFRATWQVSWEKP